MDETRYCSAFVQRISEGALSPDGTVLATASHDGYVKFWQIYIEGLDQPRYALGIPLISPTLLELL